MRIRKHAKISPLLYTCSSSNSSAVTQTHVCQLNQSPWDVMTFPPEDPTTLPPPPPPFLVDTEFYRSFMSNRTFSNHIPAQESPKKENWDDSGVAEDRSRLKKEEEIILCSRTDKKGWQCGEKVKNGHSFCEHHLTKGKSNSVNAVVHSKKSEENRRRAARSKKPASSSNPYEFYYYSGFGPRWGKKRGTGAGAAARSVVVKEEPYSSNESGSDTSIASKNNICNVDGADMEMSNSNTPEPNNVKVSNLSIFSEIDNEGGVGYVEDEEDDDDYYEDDDDDNVEIGKKRVRKPIKARSLKSLM